MSLSMGEVIRKARSELNDLTGLEISSTVRAQKEGDGWLVTMEVIEKHSIPDGMDILAIYETLLNPDGNMLEFKRTRMRKRIDTEEGEE
ncbi:MAG: gas vesicle protein [Desulfobacteraceae bacterium]|nr:gas vesicle protein [Desulfobacteraceae bacterium]